MTVQGVELKSSNLLRYWSFLLSSSTPPVPPRGDAAFQTRNEPNRSADARKIQKTMTSPNCIDNILSTLLRYHFQLESSHQLSATYNTDICLPFVLQRRTVNHSIWMKWEILVFEIFNSEKFFVSSAPDDESRQSIDVYLRRLKRRSNFFI